MSRRRVCGRASGVRDAAEHENAEARIVDTDEVSGGHRAGVGRIRVVDAPGRVGARARSGRDEARK